MKSFRVFRSPDDTIERPMHERIEINPRIHHGQPVIKGTRVPVTRILAEVAAGITFEKIEQQYDVTSEDIRAAVSFANELVEQQTFISTLAAQEG
jgi:uncharacterized protein (DUF433 family)